MATHRTKGPLPSLSSFCSGADHSAPGHIHDLRLRYLIPYVRSPLFRVPAANLTAPVFLTALPSIFQGVYQESVGIAGLHYIALGLGFVVVSQINAQLIDIVYKRLCARYGGVGKPEYRLRKFLSPSHRIVAIDDWPCSPDGPRHVLAPHRPSHHGLDRS